MTVVIEFTEDQISFSAAGQSMMETTYTYVDQDTIKVKNPDTGEDEETAYSLDSDKLTIDFGGEKIVFTKAK